MPDVVSRDLTACKTVGPQRHWTSWIKGSVHSLPQILLGFLLLFSTQILRWWHKHTPRYLPLKHSSCWATPHPYLTTNPHLLEWQSPEWHYISITPSPVPRGSQKKKPHTPATPRSSALAHVLLPLAAKLQVWYFCGTFGAQGPDPLEEMQKTKSLRLPWSWLQSYPMDWYFKTTNHEQNTNSCIVDSTFNMTLPTTFSFFAISWFCPEPKSYLRWRNRDGKAAPFPLILLSTFKILYSFFRS